MCLNKITHAYIYSCLVLASKLDDQSLKNFLSLFLGILLLYNVGQILIPLLQLKYRYKKNYKSHLFQVISDTKLF